MTDSGKCCSSGIGQAVSLQTECDLKSSRLGETEESDFSYYSPEVFTGNTQENRISDFRFQSPRKEYWVFSRR